MSQQINLLPREDHSASPAVIALIVWALVASGVFATWGVNQVRLAATREAEAASALELKQAKATIQQRDDQAKELAAEIEALKPYATAAIQLLGLAENLGSANGYSAHFSTLASVTEEGLWLTKVDISKSGKTLQVAGLTLSNDAVMRFSRSLNTVFADQGTQFTSIELTPQTVGAQASGSPGMSGDGRPLLISTKFVIR